MNLLVLIAIIAVAAAGGWFHNYYLMPGVDMLRHLFEDKKIDSVYTIVRRRADGKKVWLLRLRRNDGAEFCYTHKFCNDPFAPTDDKEWADDLKKILKGYSAWQVAYFAHWLAKERRAVLRKTTLDGNGANGWTLTFAS